MEGYPVDGVYQLGLKRYTSFTFHWLQLSHMTTANCKGVWEMSSLAGSHFPALTLYYGRGTTNIWWTAFCLCLKGVSWQTGPWWAPLSPTSLSRENRNNAISQGAVKLHIMGVEETNMLGPGFAVHGDPGSPPRGEPQNPAEHSYSESKAMTWKLPGVCPFPTHMGSEWTGRSNDLFWGAARCLVKKCWLTGVLALLLCNGRQFGGALFKTKNMKYLF